MEELIVELMCFSEVFLLHLVANFAVFAVRIYEKLHWVRWIENLKEWN